MDVTRFSNSPIGRLVPITVSDGLSREPVKHYAYVPAPLPPTLKLDLATYKATEEAAQALGRLDGAAKRLPNPHLVSRPVIRREAQSTSALEGTYAAFTDLLQSEFLEDKELSADVVEVRNYVRAAEHGYKVIKERPVSWNLVRELHEILVRGTRGDSYQAGMLRDHQVVIGPRHSSIRESHFVPPPPGDVLKEGVYAWEKWINDDDDIPLLIRVALGHYQFETLHPFNDGNGRLGRLITVLQLLDAGALTYPLLAISPWLDRRKQEYQEQLRSVSESGRFDDWIVFYLRAIQEQSEESLARAERLIEVKDELIAHLHSQDVRGSALQIVEHLIGYPVISVGEAARATGRSYQAANNAVARLQDLGVLQEVTGGSYDRLFASPRILGVLEDPQS